MWHDKIVRNERLKSIHRMNHRNPNNLTDRLKEAMIEHRKAGENIASDYVDAN